jgi:predicted membrane protein
MKTVAQWWERSRDWLDERGNAAWIIAMMIGFVLFWPIGFAILFYIIWSKRMTCCKFRHARSQSHAYSRTGNSAFDSYREETLKRLEEERDAFVRFLEELRSAKDRAEFDQFMVSRRNGNGTSEIVA